MSAPSVLTRPADPAASAEPAPARVLVVDDVGANLIAMRALLAGDGLDVLVAASGPEALELLLSHDVALALLDVQMPGMDGYALAELMRGSERTRHVPIIFLTAGSQEARASFRGYESGAVDFLYKPLDERVLRSKVAVFVELHRQRRTIAEHAGQLARLAHANALMIASLSHDIQEPLTVLALNAELLLQRAESAPLKQAAARQKAAAALLQQQIGHLISLAKSPSLDLRPQPATVDLARLVLDRRDGDVGVSGDTVGHWDPVLLGSAIDQLLMQAETHRRETALDVTLDGTSRSAVALRVRFAEPLPDAVAAHLLGRSSPLDDLPGPVGAGLRQAERVARAHGGSLHATSRSRDGTCFELLLPRGRAAAAASE